MSAVKTVIHYFNDEELAQAEDLLKQVGAAEVHRYDGLIEAAIPAEEVATVIDSKLVCDFPQGVPTPEMGVLAAAEEPEAQLFPESQPISASQEDLLRDFSQESRKVTFGRDRASFHLAAESRAHHEPELDEMELEGLLPREGEVMDQDAYLLRFSGSLRPEWQGELKGLGVALKPYQPPFIYQAMLDRRQLAAVRELSYIEAVKRYGLRETVTPALMDVMARVKEQQQEAPAAAPAAPPPAVAFDLTVHQASDLPRVAQIVESAPGIKILCRCENAMRFEIDPQSPVLAALANLPAVRLLTPFKPPKLFMDHARQILGAAAVCSLSGADLTGAGETIAMFDSGIDPQHPDLQHNNAVQLQYGGGSLADNIGHGTHVASILVGDGAGGSIPGPGLAPRAHLISVGIVTPSGTLDVPTDLGKLLKIGTAQGAKIINLSWGFPISGDYEVYGEGIDRFVHENPEILVVVASGNSGQAPQGKHLPKTIGQPAGAKNVITVGASASDRPGPDTWGKVKQQFFPQPPAMDEPVTGDIDLPAAISSRGPTDYNSVKPDVLAPGTMILAARAAHATMRYVDNSPSPNYGYLNGSSMAAPMVAGAAALLRQFLRVHRRVSQPSAALLKALLILATVRSPKASDHSEASNYGYPDFDQGFGRVDLRTILPCAGAPPQRRLSFVDVANDSPLALASRQQLGAPRKSSRAYSLNFDADATLPLRLILVWTDVPGRFVQNSLEMRLQCPDDRKFLGNQEHRAFWPQWAVGGGSPWPDRLNNVMSIVAPNPGKGKYWVTILANDTPFPPQGFALAASGEFVGDLT
jgi:serine protease AprX